MEKQIAKIPTLNDLITETPEGYKENALLVILNQNPPDKWIKEHPTAKGVKYLTIERIEYLLSRIFTKWYVEIKDTKVIANSVVVVVRLYIRSPLTQEWEYQEGIGACPIQTDKGAGAMDWNKAKNDGVMKAAPAAESYAIKDAAEKLGKIFGKDLNRKDLIGYDSLLKTSTQLDELRELYESKKDKLTPIENDYAKRIIDKQEVNSYTKLQNLLNSK